MENKKLEMTKGDIVCSYKEAADKRNQVIILSQLNLCKPENIIEILKESGIDARTLPRFDTKPRAKNTNKVAVETNTTESAQTSESQAICSYTALHDTYIRLLILLDSIPENTSDVIINHYKSLMLQLCEDAIDTSIQRKVNGETN